MAPHSSTLAWKTPRTWLSNFTFIFHFHALEKEMATHSSILAWRIPGTAEPGWVLSMGLHRVGHGWSDLAAAAWPSKIFVGSFLYKIKKSFHKRLVKLLWQMVVFGICMTKCSLVWERYSPLNLACNSALVKNFNVWLILEHQSRAYHCEPNNEKHYQGNMRKFYLV